MFLDMRQLCLAAVVECPACGLSVKAKWPGKEDCPRCGKNLGQWPGWVFQPESATVADKSP